MHSHQNIKMYPPPHLHLLTQLLLELDFWIQEVKVLMNLTSCILTTCCHPLGLELKNFAYLIILLVSQTFGPTKECIIINATSFSNYSNTPVGYCQSGRS